MPKAAFQHASIPGMNSFLDVIIVGMDAAVAGVIISAVEHKMQQMELILSCHDPHAEVFRINEIADKKKICVSPELWGIVSEAFQFNHRTNGYFDVGLKKFKDPSPAKALGNNDGIRGMELDPTDQSVKFTSALTAFDFGGIGKGILLREVGKILTMYDVENCFISFGGSSIMARGNHPYGSNWPVALRESTGGSSVFYLNDQCASFSAARNEQGRGEGYHVVNPGKYQLEKNNRITFVQCHCPVEAEVLSTTLVLIPMEEAGAMVDEFNPARAVIFNKERNQKLSIVYSHE
jgi:FAD:protein FMN transferase